MMIKVFVVYAHEDAAAAEQLVAVLCRFRVPHFIDTDIKSGSNFVQRIRTELDAATHVVVLVSEVSLRSPWVANELQMAKDAGRRVFPILLGADLVVDPTFDPHEQYLRLDPDAIDEDQLARDLVDYLFDPDGVVPYGLFRHYGKRLPSEVFAAELLTKPVVLTREKGKLLVGINRDGVENIVISNKGRAETLCERYVTPRRQHWLDLDRQIHQMIVGASDEPLKIPTHELPLRWASGGVLSVVHCRGNKSWVPLFFRDIKPVGWNVSLGSTERCFAVSGVPLSNSDFSLEKELSEPWKFIVREFLEETLVLDQAPRPNHKIGWRKFQFDGAWDIRIPKIQADKFAQEHITIRRNEDGFAFGGGQRVRVDIVNKTDAEIRITGQSQAGVAVDEDDDELWNVLIVINPLELGIEVIKVFDYEIEEDDCMLDGEILWKDGIQELVRMPFALISLEYLWETFGAPEYIPAFTDDKSLPAVRGRPFKKGDVVLYGWDVKRRREVLESNGNATELEIMRYTKWCEQFAGQFEAHLESGDPSGLPCDFTPATAKVVNTYFNCSSHGRGYAKKYARRRNGGPAAAALANKDLE